MQRRKKNGAKAQPKASTVNKATAVVVEGTELPTNFFIVKKGDRLNPQEKVSVITSPFLNSSCANTRFRFAKCTPIHKKSFPGNKYSSVPSSRKTKVVSKVWEKLTRDPNILGITQELILILLSFTFIYLLALFIVQKLRLDSELWGCTIFGSKIFHLPQTIIFENKTFNTIFIYLLATLCKIFKKFI